MEKQHAIIELKKKAFENIELAYTVKKDNSPAINNVLIQTINEVRCDIKKYSDYEITADDISDIFKFMCETYLSMSIQGQIKTPVPGPDDHQRLMFQKLINDAVVKLAQRNSTEYYLDLSFIVTSVMDKLNSYLVFERGGLSGYLINLGDWFTGNPGNNAHALIFEYDMVLCYVIKALSRIKMTENGKPLKFVNDAIAPLKTLLFSEEVEKDPYNIRYCDFELTMNRIMLGVILTQTYRKEYSWFRSEEEEPCDAGDWYPKIVNVVLMSFIHKIEDVRSLSKALSHESTRSRTLEKAISMGKRGAFIKAVNGRLMNLEDRLKKNGPFVIAQEPFIDFNFTYHDVFMKSVQTLLFLKSKKNVDADKLMTYTVIRAVFGTLIESMQSKLKTKIRCDGSFEAVLAGMCLSNDNCNELLNVSTLTTRIQEIADRLIKNHICSNNLTDYSRLMDMVPGLFNDAKDIEELEIRPEISRVWLKQMLDEIRKEKEMENVEDDKGHLEGLISEKNEETNYASFERFAEVDRIMSELESSSITPSTPPPPEGKNSGSHQTITVIQGAIPSDAPRMGNSRFFNPLLNLKPLTQPLHLKKPKNVDVTKLEREFPHAQQAIKALVKSFQDSKRFGRMMKPKPVILVGPSGTGKSSLARAFFNEIGLPVDVRNVAGVTEGFMLTGLSRNYGDSSPSLILETMGRNKCPNMAFVLDEVDKVSQDSRNGNFLNALLGLLDKKEASSFKDFWLDVPCDMSWLSWVLTVNDVSVLPSALRSRCTIIKMNAPVADDVGIIAQNLLREIEEERGLTAGWYSLDKMEITALKKFFKGDLRTFKPYVEAVVDSQEQTWCRC